MLVIVVNITLLAGVWHNRSGPPDALVTLTERELTLVGAREDDSSIALRIAFRRPGFEEEESWFDRAKLEELGFDYPDDEAPRDIHRIRSVFLVLELEEEAEENNSRLIAVDAGLDAGDLRRRYGDRSRYIVAPGSVRLFLDTDDDDEDKHRAYLQNLRTALIHVPKEHSGFLADLDAGGDQPPRYAVTLRYGRRLEPWVIEVEPLTQQ
jgi:hypothetical protein